MRKPRHATKLKLPSRLDVKNTFLAERDETQLEFLTRTDSEPSFLKIISILTASATLLWVISALVYESHPLRLEYQRLVANEPPKITSTRSEIFFDKANATDQPKLKPTSRLATSNKSFDPTTNQFKIKSIPQASNPQEIKLVTLSKTSQPEVATPPPSQNFVAQLLQKFGDAAHLNTNSLLAPSPTPTTNSKSTSTSLTIGTSTPISNILQKLTPLAVKTNLPQPSPDALPTFSTKKTMVIAQNQPALNKTLPKIEAPKQTTASESTAPNPILNNEPITSIETSLQKLTRQLFSLLGSIGQNFWNFIKSLFKDVNFQPS